MGLIKKIKNKRLGLKGSVRDDLNAIASKLFGGGGNKFDQRLTDAFSDVISGVTGTRTSNIPQIGKQVVDAKQKAREVRQNAVAGYDSRVAKTKPSTSVPLVFPETYFNEEGTTRDTFPIYLLPKFLGQ